MFMGEYRHSLDAKNRLIVPAKLRDELGSSFVVTKGLDGCLAVYTQERWLAMLAKLNQIPSTKKEARSYVRSLTSKALECTLDNQGRIQLSSYLIAAAAIEKACVIIGASDHVEIWSEARWTEYEEQADESFEMVAESLTEFLQ
ncbi:MAG: division/cell wall cluster transcriptional repressor MraZ [Solobacterium sp.]|nr:division/cell wall cluster transcriptional repressor MraZ [Solobacterium sp.]